MTKIRHYELVNPLEIATFDRILKLESSMLVDDENFSIDQFLAVFDSSFLKLLSEMREEPVQLIKEELKIDRIDMDSIIAQGPVHSQTTPT